MINLPKIKTYKKKRVGRGYGSGKGGHTAGRGTKGQKSRSKVHLLFEGTKFKKSFIKRLPLWRGKGKFRSRPKPLTVKLDKLNNFPAGSKVDVEFLIKNGVVNDKDAKKYGVKILSGTLNKKLTICLPVSDSAAKEIKKVGGKIELA